MPISDGTMYLTSEPVKYMDLNFIPYLSPNLYEAMKFANKA